MIVSSRQSHKKKNPKYIFILNVHACVRTQRLEVHIWCLSLLLSTLYFEAGLLKLAFINWLDQQVCKPHESSCFCIGITGMCHQ